VTYGYSKTTELLEAIGPAQVWERGIQARGKRDAAAKEGHAQEWSGRQGRNGEEPQAGDRDRPVRSAREGREGAAKAYQQTIGAKEIARLETSTPGSLVRSAIRGSIAAR